AAPCDFHVVNAGADGCSHSAGHLFRLNKRVRLNRRRRELRMAGRNRFIIKRNDLAVDDVVLESEGLTIGRLINNDLVLNHRTVSRTQAGIKEINGEYWVFNLSSSNRTVLNGELVDKTPLADG